MSLRSIAQGRALPTTHCQLYERILVLVPGVPLSRLRLKALSWVPTVLSLPEKFKEGKEGS